MFTCIGRGTHRGFIQDCLSIICVLQQQNSSGSLHENKTKCRQVPQKTGFHFLLTVHVKNNLNRVEKLMGILVYPCIAYKSQHEDKHIHTTLHRPVLFCSYLLP